MIRDVIEDDEFNANLEEHEVDEMDERVWDESNQNSKLILF